MEIKSRIVHPVFVSNIYGEYLLDRVWDDYLNTDRGRAEYVLLIVNDREDVNAFDADFLGEVAVSWNTYKNEFNLSQKEIEEIELKAIKLGIL